MRLCVLFGATQAELGERLTSAEFSEWIAFENAYGLPDHFLLIGQLCTLMNNLWSKKPAKPDDFVPFFRRAPRAQTVAQHRAIMASIRDGRV